MQVWSGLGEEVPSDLSFRAINNQLGVLWLKVCPCSDNAPPGTVGQEKHLRHWDTESETCNFLFPIQSFFLLRQFILLPSFNSFSQAYSSIYFHQPFNLL